VNTVAPVAAPAQSGLWGWLTAIALLAGASVVAFWPSYLARPGSASSVLVHLHAALAVGWLMWVAAQATLAHSHCRDAHRLMGCLSIAVALLFLWVALALAHQNAVALRLGPDPFRAWLLLVQLNACALWTLALAAGWCWRAKRREHTRAMAGTLVVMADPVLARLAWPLLPAPALPYAGPAAVWLLLLALIWRDHRQGMRVRAWTLLLVASIPGPLLAPTVARTEAWLALAQAFARIGAVP
jgi:hypothetical protein